MGARSARPGRHVIGDALGYHGDVARVTLRCLSCASTQSEMVDATLPPREAVKDVTCSTCGRLGMMRLVRP